MNDNISNLADMDAVEAAAFWQAKRMSGTMPPEERAALTRWLEASQSNRNALEQLEDTLAATDDAAQTILSQKFEDELYLEAQNSTAWRMPALAASVALAFVSLSATLFLNFSQQSQAHTYATAIGETRSVNLNDGSIIELNTDTTLEVELRQNMRLVTLEEGEAIFSVEHDTTKPFIVELPVVEIFVTGTVFDVAASKSSTAIYVLSGAVQVKPISGKTEILHGGDSIHIDSNGSAGSIALFDPMDVLAWRSGKLRFAETPLNEVVDELNRYFKRKIILRDQSLSMLPVTGEFDATDQAAAIDAIKLVFNLESEIEDGAIVLVKKSQ